MRLDWVKGSPIQIGGRGEDGPEYQFSEIVGAAQADVGQIAVANRGSHQIRIFSSDGAFLLSVGREGDGPGEFRMVGSLENGPNNTLLVFDRGDQRLSVFDASTGKLIQETRIMGRRPLVEVGRLGGSLYGREEDRVLQIAPGRIARDTVSYLAVNEGDSAAVQLARTPSFVTASFVGLGGETGRRAAPFTPVAIADNYSDCLFVSAGDSRVIEVMSSAGVHVARIENRWPRRAVSKDDRDAWVEYFSSRAPEELRAQIHRVFSAISFPDSLPVYQDIELDPEGYIWLQSYEVPFGLSRHWTVLSPDGTVHGFVSTPIPLNVLEITSTLLVGVGRNEYDEEIVYLFPLVRPEIDEPRSLCS